MLYGSAPCSSRVVAVCVEPRLNHETSRCHRASPVHSSGLRAVLYQSPTAALSSSQAVDGARYPQLCAESCCPSLGPMPSRSGPLSDRMHMLCVASQQCAVVPYLPYLQSGVLSCAHATKATLGSCPPRPDEHRVPVFVSTHGSPHRSRRVAHQPQVVDPHRESHLTPTGRSAGEHRL